MNHAARKITIITAAILGFAAVIGLGMKVDSRYTTQDVKRWEFDKLCQDVQQIKRRLWPRENQ